MCNLIRYSFFSLGILIFGLTTPLLAIKNNQNGYSNPSWACQYVGDDGLLDLKAFVDDGLTSFTCSGDNCEHVDGGLALREDGDKGETGKAARIKISSLGSNNITVFIDLNSENTKLTDKESNWDPSTGFVNPCKDDPAFPELSNLSGLVQQLQADRPNATITVVID